MGIGYSLTVGWQMLSLLVVIGSLAGIGYLVWDAHTEAQELAELDQERNGFSNDDSLIYRKIRL